jgi:thiamine pyrophosphokinase
MDALVVGAAPAPDEDAFYRQLLSGAGVVVAADAAAEWCVALGRVPDVAVGDFDSAVAGAPERLGALGVRVARFPSEKDDSDLDIALAEARRLGATTVTITAAAHLRLDHTLAGLGSLLSVADLQGALVEPELAAWPLDAGARRALPLEGPSGALVSVFAASGTAEGVTLEGFRYPLTEATLEPLASLGLSNELAGGPASVTLRRGRLLVLAVGRPDARASVRAVTLL